MKFVVRDNEGNEYGPVDQETLEKWVKARRVLPGMEIRNALFQNWKEATSMEILKTAFEEQFRLEEEETGKKSKLRMKKEEEELRRSTKTTFEYKHVPAPANFMQRILATVFDYALLGIFAMILFFTGVIFVYAHASSSTEKTPLAREEENVASEKKDTEKEKIEALEEEIEEDAAAAEEVEKVDNMDAETPPNSSNDRTAGYAFGSIWYDKVSEIKYSCISAAPGDALWVEVSYINKTFYMLFSVFALVFLLYYGIALGVYAQTFGMWFWGIFIARKNMEEALMLRAYLFTLLMIVFGVLAPFSVILVRRGIHDILSGTRIIKIAGQPQA